MFHTAETEVFLSELADVRTELEPWEKQLIVHKGKFDVASAERKLLIEKVNSFVYLHLSGPVASLWELSAL